MLLDLALRKFIITVLIAGVVGQLQAQESQTDLQSILVADEDLRPLIELDIPVSNESQAKPPAKPAASSVLAPADESASVLEQLDVPTVPTPAIQGLDLIIEANSTTRNPAVVAAQSKENDRKDPIFEFGIAAVPTANGLKIRGVFVGSPAQRAGLRPGDRISTIDGLPLRTIEQLTNLLIYQRALGQQFPVMVFREGQQRSFVINMSPLNTPPASTPASTPATTASLAKNTLAPPANPIPSSGVIGRRLPARQVSAQSLTGNISPGQLNTPPPPNRPEQKQPAAQRAPQQQIVRYALQEIVAGQGQSVSQQSRYAQPQPYRQPEVRRRPMGRIIGNGRIINSALRVIGR